MGSLSRIIRSYRHFIPPNCHSIQKNNWNAEFASYVKKVDIPSPPKRPLTAYMIFCKQNRKDVLKDNPSLSSPQQIKALAEKWSHLTVEMKKPYEISARESTLLYGEAHKKYYESLTEDQKEGLVRSKEEKKESRRLLKLKRTLQESGIPKAPSPAYAFFVKSQAKGKDNIKQASEFIKEVAEKWRHLSDSEKKTFKEQANADRKRYFVEMEQWRKKLIGEGEVDLLKQYDELKGRRKSNRVEDNAHHSPPLNSRKDTPEKTV